MHVEWVCVSLVLWCCVGCTAPEGGSKPTPPSTVITTTAPRPTLPEPPPPPPDARPQDYVQWSCHASKPACRDRFEWANGVDLAYTEWRGHRDLVALLDAPEFLKGGDRALVDLTPGELELVIGDMRDTDARGDRLIHRIKTERHRDFDPAPLTDWHRSQVRCRIGRLQEQ